MRDYAKIVPTFWTGKTGKALRARGSEALIVGMYLLSSPHSNMLGLYYQPILYLAHETGLGLEGAKKGLQGAIEAGFCAFDEASEMVWVYEMAGYQIASELKASDNRCAGIQKDYDALQDNPFLGDFFDKYQGAFHLTSRRDSGEEVEAPSIAPPKPLRSQEQEQEQEQEKDTPIAPRGADLFAEFWSAYPKKIGKDAAAKAFGRRKPGRELLQNMLDAIDAQKLSDQWRRDGGQYIPNPATWLNQGRWQDGEALEDQRQETFV